MEVRCFSGEEMLTYCKNKREVYHYTSPNSFLSIVDNKKLWFSDSQFMNDRSEYIYIKEIFEQAAKGTTHQTNQKEDKDRFIDYILGVPYGGIILKPLPKGQKGFSRGLMSTRYYLFCASLNSDSHSLWSYYVKNNQYQGYNIGIDVNKLVKSISNPTWKITHGMVNYDREKQIKQLNAKIIELSKQFNIDIQTGRNEDACIEHYQDELAEYLVQRCMFFKNPAFAHENEYRIVIEAPATTIDAENDKSKVGFHVSSSGLIVPHLEVNFEPEDVVKSIALAPMMEREVAKQGIRRLLSSTPQKTKVKIPINFSQIDVRY